MFKKLLVPLDGSALAESALPAASTLAQRLGASVTLIHVIEHHAPPHVHGQRHLTNPDEARAYLSDVRERAFPAQLHVEQHVHTAEVGNVARSLIEHAAELQPDLIVMCSHGRGGFRDLLFGSIAQRVIGGNRTPVLLVRPRPDGSAPPFECRLILVPLDGTPEHEEGLCVGAGLAQACGAALHMVLVVPTARRLAADSAATGRLLPGATYAMLEMSEEAAADYLGRYVAQFKASGMTATAEVTRGDPATLIVESAGRVTADVIVLATHGKAGMDALWQGSIAPKVVSHTRVPLLLVPVREK